jgi:hypothetical protein
MRHGPAKICLREGRLWLKADYMAVVIQAKKYNAAY